MGYGTPMMTYSAPVTMTTAAPMTMAAPMTYAPAYGGYPMGATQQPMLTTEAVEKQRLEATQQLTSASGAQEKMLKEQLDAQLKMLDAEAARQIELTKQTYTQQLSQQKMALTMQKQQQSMMIDSQAAAMQSQAAQYKMRGHAEEDAGDVRAEEGVSAE